MTIIWYMVPDKRSMTDNFLSFWAIFCCFTQLTNWKITILKNFEKHLEILSFCTSAPKIICYTVPGIWHMTKGIFIFHFGLFFALLPPNSPKNQNQKKKKRKKTLGDIIILHMCTKNYNHMTYNSWDMMHDGQMNGQAEIVTYSGECPT